jgi:exopolysaccharide production protein ExoQ
MISQTETSLPSPTERAFTIFVLVLSTGAFLNLAIDPGQDLEAGMPALQVIWTLIYTVTAFLLYKHPNGLAHKLKKELWLFLIVGLCLLSTIWSADPLVTARRSIALVCTTLFGMYFGTRYALRQQLQLLATTFGLLAALSLFFQLLGIGTSVDNVPGWIGVFAQKNALGLNMAFATAIFLILRRCENQNSLLDGLCALLTCLLLLFSQSATALVMLGALLLTLPVCRTLRKRNRTLFLTAIVAIPSCLYGMLWAFHNLYAVTEFLGRDIALTGRLPLWILSFVMALRRPWLGYGYDAFWRSGEGDTWAIWRAINWQAPHSHNGFLEVWLDTGIVGLAILVTGFAIYLKRALTLIRLVPTTEANWPLVFLVLLAISNLTGVSILSRNSLGWIMYVAVGMTSGTLVSQVHTVSRQPEFAEK